MFDYSGWDTTVTLGERIIEADYSVGFYPATLRNAIMNCFKETSCPITLDNDGNIWMRTGQRGSGELMTSCGNTVLVAANTAVAIAACIGLSVAKVYETVGRIKYLVGHKKEEPCHKEIEITRFCQMSDGDDTFIITTEEWAKAITNNIEKVLTLQRKKIRSGQEGGAKTCTKMKDIDFCSHSYQPILVGEKRWWLPTRPIADILSKMRLTLKVNTSRWNDKDTECVEITRSKILSYLLLYPHIRSVRYSCLGLLSITGDGPVSKSDFFRRWEWVEDISKMTGIGALKSVYGVDTLDDIGHLKYNNEINDLLVLKKNTSKTNNITRINLREYLSVMFNTMIILGIKIQAKI